MLNRESPKIAQITDQMSTLVKHADSLVYSAKPIPANIDRAVTKANDLLDAVREPLAKDLADLNTVIQQAHDTLAGVQSVLGENRRTWLKRYKTYVMLRRMSARSRRH